LDIFWAGLLDLGTGTAIISVRSSLEELEDDAATTTAESMKRNEVTMREKIMVAAMYYCLAKDG
jgi:hypothetical protein